VRGFDIRVAILALLLAAFSVACGGDGDSGGSGANGADGGATDEELAAGGRSYLLGMSSLPSDSGEDAYRETFKLAGDMGEVILIQRPPPWAEFAPGGEISTRTERLTRLEKDLAKSNGLDLFIAIDPTEPGDRGRLAGLPDSLRGSDFSDPRLRSAFIAYAKYVAFNYNPDYRALGVEVDMIFNRLGDEKFRNFQSLYFEAYDAVKSVSPDTLVFPTFQYEDLLGVLSGTLPAWSLVDRFDPKIDMLAVSSFPSFVFADANEMPEDYYAPIQQHLIRPLAFVSIGWSSATDELDQFEYLSNALRFADQIGAQLVVWYLGRDPLFTPDTAFEPLAKMGLQDSQGRPKQAWSLWSRALQRQIAK
jgi:hypothetical protein